MSDSVRNSGRAPRPNVLERAGARVLDTTKAAAAQALEAGYETADRFLPDAAVDAGLSGVELGLDVLSRGTRVIAGEDAKAAQLLAELARVDFEGIRRDDNLKADWFGLTENWLFERRPAELGEWTQDADGTARVTVTRDDFTQDLAAKPAHREATAKLTAALPEPKPGDSSTHHTTFTGEGTSSGKYDALDWFLGSYRTTLTVDSVDEARGTVKVRCEVDNGSGWESGTRMPSEFQRLGLPGFLFRDQARGEHHLGGTFNQTFRWTEELPLSAFGR